MPMMMQKRKTQRRQRAPGRKKSEGKISKRACQNRKGTGRNSGIIGAEKKPMRFGERTKRTTAMWWKTIPAPCRRFCRQRNGHYQKKNRRIQRCIFTVTVFWHRKMRPGNTCCIILTISAVPVR